MSVDIFCKELYPIWTENVANRAKKIYASISKVSESIRTQLTHIGQIFIKKSYIEFHDNSGEKKGLLLTLRHSR